MDFTASYAAVSDPAVMRLCMAYAADRAPNMTASDCKCAFLNGILEEEVFIEQPRGYAVGNPGKKALLLNAPFMGLCRRLWNGERF